MIPEHKIHTKYMKPNDIRIMIDWCKEKFGNRWEKSITKTNNPDGLWTCYWDGPNSEFGASYTWWFVEHKHAMLFSLRWL